MRCVNMSRGCVDLRYVTGDANIENNAKTISATLCNILPPDSAHHSRALRELS